MFEQYRPKIGPIYRRSNTEKISPSRHSQLGKTRYMNGQRSKVNENLLAISFISYLHITYMFRQVISVTTKLTSEHVMTPCQTGVPEARRLSRDQSALPRVKITSTKELLIPHGQSSKSIVSLFHTLGYTQGKVITLPPRRGFPCWGFQPIHTLMIYETGLGISHANPWLTCIKLLGQ